MVACAEETSSLNQQRPRRKRTGPLLLQMFFVRPVRQQPSNTEDIMDALDHRSLGNRLDLFHQQEEGPGMIFWHPRGWAIYRAIEDHIRAYMRRAGFQEVRSPQILARDLWERSGHWEKFGV